MINEERLIQTFLELVQIDSPSGEEEAVAQHLVKRLEALGLPAKRDAHGNVTVSGGGPNAFLLSAHMDTVEPGNGVKPHRDGGRIVSDGTTILGADCKGGLTAVLEALASVQEDGTSHVPLEVAFTRGEELGLLGARALDFSSFHAKQAVVFDGEGAPNRITSGTPTYIGWDVEIKGRSAHAGVEPEKGISAIQAAAAFISRLPQGRLDPESTFNTAIINGGSVRNAVPETTIVRGEFRSRNAQSLENMQRQFYAALEEARQQQSGAEFAESLHTEFEMYNLTSDEPVLKRIVAGLATIGLEPNLEPTGGGQDANILRQAGINAVAVGMSSHNAHTVREYAEISEMLNAARLCEALIKN